MGREAVKVLLAANEFCGSRGGRQSKGDVREVPGSWDSGSVKLGDRVGVLFRCNYDGGAIMRVTVNDNVMAKHTFLEAPPADAVCFFTPVARLAGIAKALRL